MFSIREAFIVLAGMSFFGVNWIFKQPFVYSTAELIYFGVVYALTLVLIVAASGRIELRLNGPLQLHLCVLILSAASLVYAPSIHYGLRELSLYVWLWIMHLLAKTVCERHSYGFVVSIYHILRVLLFCSAASIAIAMMAGQASFSLENEEEIMDQKWLYLLSTDLVSITLFFTIGLYLYVKKSPLYLFAMMVSVGILFLNFSKTYMGATMLTIMLFLWVAYRKEIKAKLILGGLLCLVLFVLSTDNPFSKQLFFNPEAARDVVVEDPELFLTLLNTSGRLSIWEYLLDESWQGAGEVIFGSGIGAARHILDNNPFGWAGKAAHGDYPRILAEYGVVGLSAYILIAFLVMRKSIRVLRNSRLPEVRMIAAVLFMVTCYLLVAGIGYEILNRYRYIMLIWITLIAVIYSRSISNFEHRRGALDVNSRQRSSYSVRVKQCP